ncbi:hypothetical protein G6F60_015217 [Rhizopus arrhizus]|nr:hypothetical protein G6F60_015217 [Rhizopus arrhizus]
MAEVEFVPFTAQSRMSGVNLGDRMIRKGAVDAIQAWLAAQETTVPDQVLRLAEDVARRGSTPLMVSDGNRALGVVELKDIVKPDIH